MKKVLLSTVALLALAGSAGAADLPVKAPRMAPPVPVAYDWNGFYVGGYFGDALGHARATTSTNFGSARLNDKGLTAGLTVGWNWQIAPTWLLGVEGDIGWLDLDRTQLDWNDRVSVGVKTDWYATARGRVGYVAGPSLIYATGGAAFVHLRDTFGGDVGAGIGPTTNTDTKTGFTVGGGIETKLSRAWTAKTEYLFIDVGDNSFGSNPYGVAGTPTTMNHSFHVIKTGLNYKFGEPFLEGLPLFGTSVNIPSNHVWGGFYAGVNAGGGISNIRAEGGSTFVTGGTEQDINNTGFAGGGHVGYNLMNVANFIGSSWFIGAEGDIGYLGLNSSQADWNDPTHIFADKTNWYATARGRVGTSTGPALLYFTGGAAWVNLTDSLTIAGLQSSTSRTAGGWTFGGGMEVALDARWSARIESLYMDVGHRTLSVGTSTAEFKDRFTVVRAGLSYSFGGP
jgi:outer membrane immunogenic protein